MEDNCQGLFAFSVNGTYKMRVRVKFAKLLQSHNQRTSCSYQACRRIILSLCLIFFFPLQKFYDIFQLQHYAWHKTIHSWLSSDEETRMFDNPVIPTRKTFSQHHFSSYSISLCCCTHETQQALHWSDNACFSRFVQAMRNQLASCF